ncbi:IclR family transcriptional regulator [Streptomyces prasinus]
MARTLTVLGTFDDQHRRMSLAEIARRATLPEPTTFRILRELVAAGALVRADDRTYSIGRMLWDLGLLSAVETDRRDVASPYLHDLHAATRATVHLAIREDVEVLYLDRLSGQASVPVVSRVGSRLPLYPTGVGKVLLAHAPDDVIQRVLSSLRRFTPYTVTTPGSLSLELARIRSDGYATTREEMTLGACSLAVPIRHRGQVVAAIAVVVPDFRRDKARLLGALTVAAHAIERSYRAQPQTS